MPNTVLMHLQNANECHNYKWLASSLRKSRSKMVPHGIIRTIFLKHFQNMTSLPTISSLRLCKRLRKHVIKCDQRSRNKQFKATKPTLHRFRYSTPKQHSTTPGQNIPQDFQTHLDIPNSRCLRTIAANGHPFLIFSFALVAA